MYLKSSDIDKINDKKIHNIRPSEDLVVDFINWNIDAICILRDYCDLKKKNYQFIMILNKRNKKSRIKFLSFIEMAILNINFI